MAERPTRDQFQGCLIGQAIGDGLGAPYEGLPTDLVDQFGPAETIVQHTSGQTLFYTDDTQMAIGVAEALLARGEIDEKTLCAAFIENYDAARGYGQGARKLINAMAEGGPWRRLREEIFPGGSMGNGAAMRAAPIGLLFCDDLDRVALEAERSAVPTHTHPYGIDGARVVALAVALALREPKLDRKAFFRELSKRARTEEFQWQLSTAAKLTPDDSLLGFGNTVVAHRSVVTAIACFAASPTDYTEVVRRAISLGNDTDTLAAIAGAISGAHLGLEAIPLHLIDRLEDGAKGRPYLITLGNRLHDAYRERIER